MFHSYLADRSSVSSPRTSVRHSRKQSSGSIPAAGRGRWNRATVGTSSSSRHRRPAACRSSERSSRTSRPPGWRRRRPRPGTRRTQRCAPNTSSLLPAQARADARAALSARERHAVIRFVLVSLGLLAMVARRSCPRGSPRLPRDHRDRARPLLHSVAHAVLVRNAPASRAEAPRRRARRCAQRRCRS